MNSALFRFKVTLQYIMNMFVLPGKFCYEYLIWSLCSFNASFYKIYKSVDMSFYDNGKTIQVNKDSIRLFIFFLAQPLTDSFVYWFSWQVEKSRCVPMLFFQSRETRVVKIHNRKGPRHIPCVITLLNVPSFKRRRLDVTTSVGRSVLGFGSTVTNFQNANTEVMIHGTGHRSRIVPCKQRVSYFIISDVG